MIRINESVCGKILTICQLATLVRKKFTVENIHIKIIHYNSLLLASDEKFLQ